MPSFEALLICRLKRP